MLQHSLVTVGTYADCRGYPRYWPRVGLPGYLPLIVLRKRALQPHRLRRELLGLSSSSIERSLSALPTAGWPVSCGADWERLVAAADPEAR